MIIKTIFAGFGGQGVLSMGYILALAAMHEGSEVTYLPAYGAEVRGGAANCTVSVGDEEIASPIASEPEFVVVMNKPSLLRFQNHVQAGGEIFVNSSMIDIEPSRKDITVHSIPATEMAEELGEVRAANMVMLGAFVKKTRLISAESVEGAIEEFFSNKKKVIAINKEAFGIGIRYAENNDKDI